MTVLPQLQQALVEAAAGPPRRVRPRVRVVAGPLLALSVLVVLLVVAASALRAPQREAGGRRDAPVAVPAASVARAAALAAAPSPGGESKAASPDELVALARQLSTELPYPPGLTDDDLVPLVTRQAAARDMSALSVAGEVRFEAAYRASCAWQRFWLGAYSGGDAAGLRAATEVLGAVPDWPSFRQSPAPPKAIAAAAGAGDAARIQRQVALNCGFTG